MFKDSLQGKTHFENDGCGEPAHNGYRDKEIVICAAVVAADGRIFRGHRHNNCLDLMYQLKVKQRPDHEAQGFITSRNRYVDRKEGLRIQKTAGIPSNEPGGYTNELYSEDLY